MAGSPCCQIVRLRQRITRRLRGELVGRIAGTPLQFALYASYWRWRLRQRRAASTHGVDEVFICQVPDYGAGIGHQLANWNAGRYFAERFGARFAHCPFSSDKWEKFLGFGLGEVQAAELKHAGYSSVRLPRFDSVNQAEVALVESIVHSYAGSKTLLELEINQGYIDQYETWRILQQKFFDAPARRSDSLMYRPGEFTVAVHIRRGDIMSGPKRLWAERGLNNSYFVAVLETALHELPAGLRVKVFLFSQGHRDEFPEFAGFPEIVWCLDMNPYDSFAHMARADLLITSKSSFSYKPALISRGVKICPKSFWHQYPNANGFVLADDNGRFDTHAFTREIVLAFREQRIIGAGIAHK